MLGFNESFVSNGAQGIENSIQVAKHQVTDSLQLLQYW